MEISAMVFVVVAIPANEIVIPTLYIIHQETGSRRWTLLAALLPLGMGFAVTFVVAQVWRLVVG